MSEFILKINPSPFQGIMIEDSYNNLLFPLKRPQIDKNEINYPEFLDQFKTFYDNRKQLPWHYVIEFFENDYLLYNTLPLNMKYPVNYQFDTNKNFEDYIHILIIGDTNTDVYTKALYKKIAKYIITPMSKIHRFDRNNYIPVNLGKKFNPSLIKQFLIL